MFTLKYKGGFINGYCDKAECSIVFKGANIKCKTFIGAKRAITKLIKEGV